MLYLVCHSRHQRFSKSDAAVASSDFDNSREARCPVEEVDGRLEDENDRNAETRNHLQFVVARR